VLVNKISYRTRVHRVFLVSSARIRALCTCKYSPRNELINFIEKKATAYYIDLLNTTIAKKWIFYYSCKYPIVATITSIGTEHKTQVRLCLSLGKGLYLPGQQTWPRTEQE